MRIFLWAALACFAIAVICAVSPSLLQTPASAWGWGGLAAFVLDLLTGAVLPVSRAPRQP
jgi:hypothetical protein